MKSDECAYLTGKNIELRPKRRDYLLKKWTRKGWYRESLFTSNFTPEGRRIRELILKVENSYDIPEEYDGRVVTVYGKTAWIGHGRAGIFRNQGDMGWYFYTVLSVRRKSCWFIEKKDIAYIDLHPNPHKIWRKINYEYWQHHKIPDFFHNKVGFLYRVEGYKEGECLPTCQCKFLGI